MNSGAWWTPGSQKQMIVPEPGWDFIFHQPPAICARSRVAVNPRWPGTDPLSSLRHPGHSPLRV